jgi:hypothetical protein
MHDITKKRAWKDVELFREDIGITTSALSAPKLTLVMGRKCTFPNDCRGRVTHAPQDHTRQASLVRSQSHVKRQGPREALSKGEWR